MTLIIHKHCNQINLSKYQNTHRKIMNDNNCSYQQFNSSKYQNMHCQNSEY